MAPEKMQIKNYNVYFFFSILIFISVVTFFIFKPFLVALLLASILAIFFSGIYDFFLRISGQRKSLSSFITSLVILLLIIIPLVIVSVLVGEEVIALYQSIAGSGDFYQKYLAPLVNKIHTSPLYDMLKLDQILSKESFAQYSSQFGQSILLLLQSAYLSISHVIFLVFVMFFSLYYFFMDGKDLVRKVMYISPLKDTHESMLIQKFISISRATIKGTFIVCMLQGFIGGMVFYIAGVPSAVIWGVVMALLSLIPMLGASIVWFPVAIAMLMMGNIWEGVLIIAVGLGLVSTIDNILKPKLVGKDTQIHPLMVFFATLGGLAMFGLAGFILGPIIVALFISLWEIYGIEFKSQLKKYNK